MAYSHILIQAGGTVMANGKIIETAKWALATTPEYQQFARKFRAKCGAEPITPQSYDKRLAISWPQ